MSLASLISYEKHRASPSEVKLSHLSCRVIVTSTRRNEYGDPDHPVGNRTTRGEEKNMADSPIVKTPSLVLFRVLPKSNHTTLAQSCRGEAFAQRPAALWLRGEQPLRQPRRVPCPKVLWSDLA
jgi:hypothetical protein